MDLIYIDKTTGAYGDVDNLLIVDLPEKTLEDKVSMFPEVPDSIIIQFGLDWGEPYHG